MQFTITDKDNNTQVVDFDQIDVPAINRRGVSVFQYGDVALDIDNNEFAIGAIKLPFIHEDSEFILFRRVQQTYNTDKEMMSETSVVVFGLRKTIELADGTLKNNIQLVWCYPDEIKIGGNK